MKDVCCSIQTGYGVEAANSLLQAAEVVLPKQKKAMAVSEYKHSIIAHKRRSKSHHNDGGTNCDILLFLVLGQLSLIEAVNMS